MTQSDQQSWMRHGSDGVAGRYRRSARPWREPAPSCRRAGASDQTIAHLVSRALLVPVPELLAPTRCCARTAGARQLAMYLAHVALGLSYTGAGRLFGRDRTTAAHACRLVEEKREDPLFDASVDHLERALRARASGLSVQVLR